MASDTQFPLQVEWQRKGAMLYEQGQKKKLQSYFFTCSSYMLIDSCLASDTHQTTISHA